MDQLSVLDPSVSASDEPVGPDQYRYLSTHAWRLGTFATPRQNHAHLIEHVMRQWIPAQPDRDWLLDHQVTGNVQWLAGSEQQARAAGFDPSDSVPVGRFLAPHGNFHANGLGDEPGRRPQSWHAPTPVFLAGLPRDPGALLERLRADNPEGRTYSGPFTAATDTLRTCLVPADLRMALYQSLVMLPTVKVVEGVADLGGRSCLALVHDDGPTRTELLINPADGQYAGERDTLRRDSRCGLTAGTVINSTATHTAVVDELGALPAR